MEFRSKIIINASSDIVFNIIARADNYMLFDSSCLKIEGEIGLGKTIKIYSKLRPERAFKVRVTKLLNNQLIVWETGLPFNLFKGVRTLSVLAKDDQTSEFNIEEKFSGYLLKLFKKNIPDMTENFDNFAKSLKKHVESHI